MFTGPRAGDLCQAVQSDTFHDTSSARLAGTGVISCLVLSWCILVLSRRQKPLKSAGNALIHACTHVCACTRLQVSSALFMSKLLCGLMQRRFRPRFAGWLVSGLLA